MSEYVRNPQVKWLELIGPEQDGLALLRPPWRFGGQRPHREQHVAAVGEHTREIALEGYDEATVDHLIADGVLFTGGGTGGGGWKAPSPRTRAPAAPPGPGPRSPDAAQGTPAAPTHTHE